MPKEKLLWTSLTPAQQEAIKFDYLVGRFRTPADLADEHGLSPTSLEKVRRAEDWDALRSVMADEIRKALTHRLVKAGAETAEQLAFAMRDLSGVVREKAAQALDAIDIDAFNVALELTAKLTTQIEKMRGALEGLSPSSKPQAPVLESAQTGGPDGVDVARALGNLVARSFTAAVKMETPNDRQVVDANGQRAV